MLNNMLREQQRYLGFLALSGRNYCRKTGENIKRIGEFASLLM
jgi:hypothetical protein